MNALKGVLHFTTCFYLPMNVLQVCKGTVYAICTLLNAPSLFVCWTGVWSEKIAEKKTVIWTFISCSLFRVVSFSLCRIPLCTLIKKKIKFPSYISKFRVWAVAKSNMTNGLLIYGEIFVHFLIHCKKGELFSRPQPGCH